MAYLIDLFIILTPFLLIGILVGLAGGDVSSSLETGMNFVSFIVGWLYYALQESGVKQATIGKRAMGMRVFNMAGQKISFGQASGRFFAKILSGLTIGIGYLMVAFTQRKQGLHDMIAGTVVLYRGE